MRAFLFVAVSLAVALVTAACAGGDTADRSDATARTTTTRDPGIVVMVAVGDIVCEHDEPPTPDTCQQEATADLAASLSPDVVVTLGDLQYDRGDLFEFESAYEASWGRFKDITRPVPGNHEYQLPGAKDYYTYWGEAAHPPDGWYSFDIDVAGWHVVMANSNCDAVGCGVGSPQEQWLRADLAASTAQCTMLAMHHPEHASGMHGGTGAVIPLVDALEEDRGDLVVAAHDHLYERSKPVDGIRHFVAGMGGRSLYAVDERDPDSELVENTHFGVLELRLRAGGYQWRYHTIDAGVLDEGSGTCQ